VAHGFAAITDLLLWYQVDSYYNPNDELGLAWTTRRRRGLGHLRPCAFRQGPDQPEALGARPGPSPRAGLRT